MRGRRPGSIAAGSSPVTTALKPPAYLAKDAKSEWRRVAPILIAERKVLTEGDIAALENYVIAVATMRQAHRDVQDHGLVLPSGKRNPASTALTQAQQQQLRAAAELGLTPSSRSRAPMRDNDENELSFLD